VKRFSLRAALALALAFVPEIAWACPGCFVGKNDENRVAFIAMTGFLTLLPLALIGGAVWWYLRRLRDVEKRSRAFRHAARSERPVEERVVKVPQGYFDRGYASTAKDR
jgi:hypothetical protein